MARGKALSKAHQVEIITFLAEARGVPLWLQVLHYLMRDTGLRLSEAICLTFGVLWQDGAVTERLHIDGRIRKGKNPLSYTVTLSHDTRRLIQSHANAMNERGLFGANRFMFPGRVGSALGHMHRSTAYSHLKGLFRAALGAECAAHYTAHSLRRTKATDVFRSSGDIVACQFLLGHKFIGSTTRYIEVSPNDISNAERKVYQDLASFRKTYHPQRVWRGGHAVAVQRELFGDHDFGAGQISLSAAECADAIEVSVAARKKAKNLRKAERFNGQLPKPAARPPNHPPTSPPFWSSTE